MCTQKLGIFISFLGAIAVAQVAAAAAPEPAQGGQSAPVPNTGAPRASASMNSGELSQSEYLRNMSIHVGLIGPTSLQSLDTVCPRRHIGINSAPFDVRHTCWPPF